MAKAVTPYQRHLRRLTRQARRMEERYYFFPPDFYDKLKGMNARQLSHLKTDWLYRQAKFEDVETQEIFTGVEGKKIEQKRRAKKAAETRRQKKEKEAQVPQYDDVVFQRFEEDFNAWLRSETERYIEFIDRKGKRRKGKRSDEAVSAENRAKSILAALYERAKAENPEMLARRIEESSDFIGDTIIRIQSILYDVEDINAAVDAVAEIIKGDRISMTESIQIQMDAESGEYEWQG